MGVRQYAYNVGLAVDQLLNAILGGTPDESLSSRVGRKSMEGFRFARVAEKVIDWLFFVTIGEVNHCRNALEDVEDRGTRDIWK